MKALLDQLLRHMRWADARVYTSLRAMPVQQSEAVRLFAHIATTERLYLARMLEEDPFPQDFWPELSLGEAASVAEAAGAGLAALIMEREEVALQRTVRYRNSKGTYYDTPLQEMLVHLALHGEHHRGQIARLTRESGGEPAVTDLIVFVREEEPPWQTSA